MNCHNSYQILILANYSQFSHDDDDDGDDHDDDDHDDGSVYC